MTSEITRLSASQRAAVEKAIKLTKAESGIHTVPMGAGGKAYLYASSNSVAARCAGASRRRPAVIVWRGVIS